MMREIETPKRQITAQYNKVPSLPTPEILTLFDTMSASLFSKLTPEKLRKVIKLRRKIEALQIKINAILETESKDTSLPKAKKARKRRKFSAATRAKMAASQKARHCPNQAEVSQSGKGSVTP